MRTQLSIAEGFHVVYEPIGTDENVAHITTLTPEGHLVKASRLESAYAELQQELAEEVASIDARLLKPATEAKEGLKCLRKVIKKREDRKVCFILSIRPLASPLIYIAGLRTLPLSGRSSKSQGN